MRPSSFAFRLWGGGFCCLILTLPAVRGFSAEPATIGEHAICLASGQTAVIVSRDVGADDPDC